LGIGFDLAVLGQSCERDDPTVLSDSEVLEHGFSSKRIEYYQASMDQSTPDTLWQEAYLDWIPLRLLLD
jgi:hypothetical protein